MDFTDIIPIAPQIGYPFLTLVGFFGSLIPFVPIPSFIVLATMSVGEQFNIHILAFIFAITSTAAKQVIFYASYGGGKIIKEKTRKRMKPFERFVKRYGGAAAFIAAATPVPDDLVYIPLGLAKYNPKRFLVATLTGKIVLSYMIVLSSHFLGISLVEPYLEEIEDPMAIYIGIIIFGIILAVTIIFLLRLDWAKVLGSIAPWTLDEDENNSKS